MIGDVDAGCYGPPATQHIGKAQIAVDSAQMPEQLAFHVAAGPACPLLRRVSRPGDDANDLTDPKRTSRALTSERQRQFQSFRINPVAVLE